MMMVRMTRVDEHLGREQRVLLVLLALVERVGGMVGASGGLSQLSSQ